MMSLFNPHKTVSDPRIKKIIGRPNQAGVTKSKTLCQISPRHSLLEVENS